jgi:rod shape-determining protein MreC
MAPPRHRRPGFSRRAQYGLFASYVIAVIGVVIGVALILMARFDPVAFSGLRGLALDMTRPFTAGGRAVVRGVEGTGEAIGAYFRAGSQNAALRAELEAQRAALVQARASDFENRRLKRVLRIVETTPETVAVTRIIGSTAGSTRRMVTLDAGAGAGVRSGQPVRAPEGLIGRVLETGRLSARVLLVTDTTSTVPVQLTRSGLAALATGQGDGRIELRALVAGSRPFRRGDVAITSGIGGVYPPGIPVAVIVAVEGDLATAWPLADPSRLDFAIVMRAIRPDLPPPAKATP